MKSIRHYTPTRRNQHDTLHIETDGAIVNIRVGLRDSQGRPVTAIEVIPDDEARGGDGQGRIWHLAGEHNTRVIMVKDPTAEAEGWS